MNNTKTIIVLVISVVLLATANLLFGSVDIPAEQVFCILFGGEAEKSSWEYIIIESRIPQAITAILCGSSLAVSGLLLQTTFHNPLAGPSILGITSGASLGVALVTLLFGGVLSFGVIDNSGIQVVGFLAIIIAAFLGSMLIIALLLMLSTIIKNNLMLLIVGIMVSYLASSIVALCNFFANADDIQSFVLWGMGSFSDVTLVQLPFFSGSCLVGLTLSMLLIKPLNLILLGENYATNLGINIQGTRRLILITTGILTAVTTAFCGPIGFIGLAVPHIARLITRTSNHTVLIPATILTGAAIALLCNLICCLPESTIIPLNAVTPLFGVPVIVFIIIKKQTA